MAARRSAIAVAALALAIAAPACKFSRSANDASSSSSSTTETTASLFEDLTTSLDGTSTTSAGDTATSLRTATTTRSATATTRAPSARVATTARPAAPATPHCDASAADTFYGSSWTVNVTSTFPNSEVIISISWPGGSGNYSNNTDPNGSFSKTQRVNPTMQGQTISVSVTVAGRVHCSTSFRVS
jgi:hypothetical protein